ncbi:MAG: hypothetical protein JSV30_06280 [Candidatus Omnitrophota bacterium]|nr:MAG: hypothetical protein JSV30_06280 [Candidatus Omnitrophota bacterium]
MNYKKYGSRSNCIWRVIRFITICLTLVFLFNTPAFALGSSVADFLCEIAIKYYEQGKYEDALHEFKKALMVMPQHPQALKYIQVIEQKLALLKPQREIMPPAEAIQALEVSEELERKKALNRALDQAEALILVPEAEAGEEEVEEIEEWQMPQGPQPEMEEIYPSPEEEIYPYTADEELYPSPPEEAYSEPLIEMARAEDEEQFYPPHPEDEAETSIFVPEAEAGEEEMEEIIPEPMVKKGEEAPEETYAAKEVEKEKDEDTSPIKISGEFLVSLGTSDKELIWKEANGDYNEANWRRIDESFGVNTYDRRIYDRLRVNIDTEKEEGLNFHSNITMDPWTFIGKSNKIRATSLVGDESAEIQLKYWSGTRSIINESVDFTTDVFNIPETKVLDGKVAPFRARGIEFAADAFDVVNIPELEIHQDYWPVRELWFDYKSEDKFHFRFFPVAYQDQALSSDDPLKLSNHRIYWEESPWLDRWQSGRVHTDVVPEDFTRGQWEDDLSFFTRDSNMVYLTSLRGYSMKSKPWENLTIESTAATPKGLWQDYDAVDNIAGATRIKFIPQDDLLLGLIHTFRYGLEKGDRDAENRVVGGDICYNFFSDFHVKGEVAHSWDERDLTQETYDTDNEGNAYKFELKRGKLKEERPERWDEEAYAKAEPFDYALRLSYTRMDEDFYPGLATYRITRRDPFWGRHIHFEQPYREYYGGLYEPTLTWDDIRPFRIGDSVDIDREVAGLRLEKAFLGGDLETLFDCRRAHEVSEGKYIETIGRTEADWYASERLLIKFLALYHDLPDTTGGIDPIIYDVDSNKFLLNDEIEDGADPSLKTVSAGFQYGFFDWLSFDCIYERTNDFTVALDDYPRRLLSNPNFTTVTEDGLIWREPAPFLYNNYLFPLPSYPWFNIYKAALELEPNDDLKLRVEFTKNDYKFAGQIDDNINHLGFEADWDITEKLSLQLNYTYARSYNLWKQVNGVADGALEYEKHHNAFVNLNYKMDDKGIFTVQFGEGALMPYSAMFTTSPYSGFIPTLDTAHIIRAYFSRKF